MPSDALVLTCEHGGHRVPRAYRVYFAGAAARSALVSHRGFDPGALELARGMSMRLRAPLYAVTTTRLLVEPNRSIGHPRLFSEFTRNRPLQVREELLDRYYHPHRQQVERAIQRRVARRRRVVHIGMHSFVPIWHGEFRAADVGLLYDPSRRWERRLCQRWKHLLGSLAPSLRVRRNYPYRGVSDGLVTHLRNRFGPRQYAAIELEVSQGLIGCAGPARRQAVSWLAQSLSQVLESEAR